MTPEELLEKLEKAAALKGYYLNADREFCIGTAESLIANKERYGYMCCPCRLASDDRKVDSDIICPCVYRDDDIAEFGACMCSFYVSEEHKDDADFFPEVDERRDPSRGI